MGRAKCWAVIGVVVAGLTMPAAWAMTEAIAGQPGYIEGALRKLGRGIANVATCPAELIRTPEAVRIKDGFLASISVGVLQGAWRTVQRGVVGLFEVATFYAEVPADFKPIMQPEFVFAHGDWVQQE